MRSLLIWLIIVGLVAAAVLAVVRAALALPIFAGLAPYTTLIYSFCVLLVILVVVSHFYGGNVFGLPAPRVR